LSGSEASKDAAAAAAGGADAMNAGQCVAGDWSSHRPLLISAPCIVKSSAKSHVTHSVGPQLRASPSDPLADSDPPTRRR